ncbi:hypothetical protein S7711_02647 [Stachybotrys chartarum IBT 7711]|uniref:LYR motif-containing protein Cup1-like N-terminal domain-containing protein n=1 Tax=Stachybotrys chartarum (strain CBS 109288 / IBT 7711) TaxID=1280523 RepID=A0A084B928_STACB|nr:hypothetical protein S7711_02647 [Stachybotrys chartarum IBT 7711]
MPAPHEPICKSLSTLQLYRHLLREITYLPPAVRPHIQGFAQRRFHKKQDNDFRAKEHVRRALTYLRTLRACNSGDKRATNSVIATAFAKKGPRRFELLKEFNASDGSTDKDKLEEAIAAARVGTSEAAPGKPSKPKKFYQKWDEEKIKAYLTSQRTQIEATKLTLSWGVIIRRPDPDVDIPELNIWGKPLNQGLIENKRGKWWKRHMDKLAPPLGEGEWELLGKLSKGAQQEEPEWQTPSRRAKATPTSVEAGPQAWDWELYATKSPATFGRPTTASQLLRTGHTAPYAARKEVRELSPRWYRRTYNRLWQQTAKVHRDPATLKHEFTWGKSIAKIPLPTKAQLVVFEGVPDTASGKTKKKNKGGKGKQASTVAN